jgi:hypothetical protein
MQDTPPCAKGKVIEQGARFTKLLNTYLGDAGQAAQFVYAYLTIHAIAGNNGNVRHGLNNEAGTQVMRQSSAA